MRERFPRGEMNTVTRSTASMPSHLAVLMEPGDAYACIAFAFPFKKALKCYSVGDMVLKHSGG